MKAKKDWCSGGGRRPTKTIKHRKKVPKWLARERGERGDSVPRNSFVRCEVCDQRFEAYAIGCCGGLCGVYYIVPRHKATV